MNHIEMKSNIQSIMQSNDINRWENNFLKSIYHQIKPNIKLSPRQLNKFDEIKNKIRTKENTRTCTLAHKMTTTYIPSKIMNELESRIKEELNDDHYNIYLYGSQMYGNTHINSDYDFLIIYDGEIDITYKSKDDFIKYLKDGNINFIENSQGLVKESFPINVEIKIDKVFIKNAINQARNSLYKGIKFIQSNKSSKVYKGHKSLFHSLRILNNISPIIHNESIDFDQINQLANKTKNYSEDDYKSNFNNFDIFQLIF